MGSAMYLPRGGSALPALDSSCSCLRAHGSPGGPRVPTYVANGFVGLAPFDSARSMTPQYFLVDFLVDRMPSARSERL